MSSIIVTQQKLIEQQRQEIERLKKEKQETEADIKQLAQSVAFVWKTLDIKLPDENKGTKSSFDFGTISKIATKLMKSDIRDSIMKEVDENFAMILKYQHLIQE